MEITEYHPFKSAGAKEEYLALNDTRAMKWPIASENRIVDTSYGQTFVRIGGPANAPPLVLLPGFGNNSLMWMLNIKALSGSYRTYAVDNVYDWGRSVYTREAGGADDLIDWLDGLFTALKPGDRINLMGMSYGGWLAALYALRHPERLNKAVLLSPAATLLPMQPKFIILMMLGQLPHPYFARVLYRWICRDLIQKDEASRKYAEDMYGDIQIARRCFKPLRIVPPTVLEDEELRGIKVPVLYLGGENEKIYSSRKALERIHRVAPGIKAEVIPGAGHDLVDVRAEIVDMKVLEFLGQA